MEKFERYSPTEAELQRIMYIIKSSNDALWASGIGLFLIFFIPGLMILSEGSAFGLFALLCSTGGIYVISDAKRVSDYSPENLFFTLAEICDKEHTIERQENSDGAGGHYYDVFYAKVKFSNGEIWENVKISEYVYDMDKKEVIVTLDNRQKIVNVVLRDDVV